MSETSQAYKAGFAKLLPQVWNPLMAIMHYGQEGDHFLVPIPCPDIREPGNEALAWRALVALIQHAHKQLTPELDRWLDEAWNTPPADALYAAVERIEPSDGVL